MKILINDVENEIILCTFKDYQLNKFYFVGYGFHRKTFDNYDDAIKDFNICNMHARGK